MSDELKALVERVFAKHRRHIELSPGVGADLQRYALATLDDVQPDLERALLSRASGSEGVVGTLDWLADGTPVVSMNDDLLNLKWRKWKLVAVPEEAGRGTCGPAPSPAPAQQPTTGEDGSVRCSCGGRMNTKEIEERHDYHGTKPFPNTATMWKDIARAAHKDRGDLLQEVKRLEAFVGKVVEAERQCFDPPGISYDANEIDQALADLDRANNKETQ